MDDGPFTPMLLASARLTTVLAPRRPLVFINACRSSGEVFEYTRPTGWAKGFMAAGAGAFIGTLWTVRSSTAREFAEAFYTSLVSDGTPLGEAARQARLAVRRDSEDPTWLAYTVYGDPAATVTPAAPISS